MRCGRCLGKSMISPGADGSVDWRSWSRCSLRRSLHTLEEVSVFPQGDGRIGVAHVLSDRENVGAEVYRHGGVFAAQVVRLSWAVPELARGRRGSVRARIFSGLPSAGPIPPRHRRFDLRFRPPEGVTARTTSAARRPPFGTLAP
jgi:hypothetical protein